METTFDSKYCLGDKPQANEIIYDVYRGESGYLWLVANNVKNKSDFVYRQGEAGSNGFGGREIEFKISHGDSIMLKGAWASTAESMFKDTGKNFTGKHKFLIVLSTTENTSKDPYRKIYKDVVLNTGWVVGDYAPEYRAKEMANKINKRIYYSGFRSGGIQSHYKDPD